MFSLLFFINILIFLIKKGREILGVKRQHIVTDRNRGTQHMRLYVSVDDSCADCWKCVSAKCVWRYNALDSLEFRQADPVEFGELVASRELNAEEVSRKILTHTGWELKPFSWRAQGRAKPVDIVPLPLALLS